MLQHTPQPFAEQRLLHRIRAVVEHIEVAAFRLACQHVQQPAGPAEQSAFATVRQGLHQYVKQQLAHRPRQRIHAGRIPHCQIPFVTGKHLVRSVAGESHGDVFPGEPAQQIGRQHRRIRIGFAVVGGEFFQQCEIARIHHLFKMAQLSAGPAVDRPCRRRSPFAFIVSGDFKADGECIGFRRSAKSCREAGHNGRIEAAGKKRPERHIGHQALSHRPFHQPA